MIWLAGGAVVIWWLSQPQTIASLNPLPYGETVALPLGPTTIGGPEFSVQAGGFNPAYIVTLNQQVAAGGIQSATSN